MDMSATAGVGALGSVGPVVDCAVSCRGLRRRGPPLRARSAQSSGPAEGLRLTHSIVRFGGRRSLHLLVNHVQAVYVGVGARAVESHDVIAILL